MRLQTRMMAVLRGVVFACLRVNVSMSRTPVSQRVSVAAQRLAMLLCIEWSWRKDGLGDKYSVHVKSV